MKTQTSTRTPSRANKQTPSPHAANGRNKKRTRSYSSILINMGVLVALFAVVFALQLISNRTDEEPGEAVSVIPPSIDAVAVSAPPPTEIIRDTSVINMEEIERCQGLRKTLAALEAAPTEDKEQTRYAPAKRTRTSRTPRRRIRRVGAEDRARSAELVRLLDGGYHRRRAADEYNDAMPAPQPRTVSDEAMPPHSPRRYDLDDEFARQHYLKANRMQTGARTTEPRYESPPPEIAMTKRTTPARTGRKPAWEANVGP